MAIDPGVSAALQGAALGAGLCATLGPQSVFVLRQGILRQSALATATICALCDLLVIGLGAAGFDALSRAFPDLTRTAALGGAAFVIVYGALVLRAALAPESTSRPRRDGRRIRLFAAAVRLGPLKPQV